MGKDAQQIRARLPGGDDIGRLQYEPPKLIFRGRERHSWPSVGLAVRADGPDLVLPDGARFALGEKQAAGWAHAILNPPSRLTKLGVKAGMRVAIDGVDDEDFAAELATIAPPAILGDELDLVFYGAGTADALAALPERIARLAEKGAIWVVSPKGKGAAVKDTEVIAAGRAAGLVDTKVCAFSPTHTALRFTLRRQR